EDVVQTEGDQIGPHAFLATGIAEAAEDTDRLLFDSGGMVAGLTNVKEARHVLISPGVMKPCQPQPPTRRMLGVSVRVSKVSPSRYHPCSVFRTRGPGPMGLRNGT